jgi:predicted ATP-grasp superfamily ATP-dependent carboligase/protein-tyrosine-phosphatase
MGSLVRMGKVLVLGEDSRSCLAVVRSLGRKGVPIALGVQADELAVASYSRYATQVIQMPSTQVEVEAWLVQLQEFLEREPIALVIPCSDSTIIPLVRNRARFEPLSRLAVPDAVGFEYTSLKDKTLEMARELGVPAPDTILVTDKHALSRISSERLRFPLIIKPVSSKVWKDGRRFDLRVSTVSDFSAMQRVADDILEIEPVLIQEHFDGIGVGQEFLAHEGSILSAFQHERVHEPLGGGGSSYRKSVPLDEEMLECSRRMLARLRWEGVAMIEYRKNPATGEFTLMEINGRFWGSLPLAVATGVDFPYQLYRLMVHGELPKSAPYRIGLFGRNLQKDLGWFKERLSANPSRMGSLRLLVQQMIVGLKHTLLGKERWDVITLDDPVPGIVEVLSAVRSLRGRIRTSVRKVSFAVLASSRRWRQMQRTRLRRLLNIDPKLLFVCRGNVCRSPFAEGYTKLRLASLGLGEIETLSAGTYPVGKRLPPQLARNVSLEFGVRLDEHRSRVLERQLTKWAGAIVCMDLRDYRDLRTEFPEVKGKLFLLKPFDEGARDWEIPDPWGKSPDAFRRGYAHISSSVEGLIQGLVH